MSFISSLGPKPFERHACVAGVELPANQGKQRVEHIEIDDVIGTEGRDVAVKVEGADVASLDAVLFELEWCPVAAADDGTRLVDRAVTVLAEEAAAASLVRVVFRQRCEFLLQGWAGREPFLDRAGLKGAHGQPRLAAAVAALRALKRRLMTPPDLGEFRIHFGEELPVVGQSLALCVRILGHVSSSSILKVHLAKGLRVRHYGRLRGENRDLF